MPKEIERLKGYLKQFPNLDIWVISKDNLIAKIYWKAIQVHINVNKKPHFISSRETSIDGLNSRNAVILLCGHWYFNSITDNGMFKMYLKDAKFTLPIGEIPEPKILNNKQSVDIKTSEDVCKCFGIAFGAVHTNENVKLYQSWLKNNKKRICKAE